MSSLAYTAGGAAGMTGSLLAGAVQSLADFLGALLYFATQSRKGFAGLRSQLLGLLQATLAELNSLLFTEEGSMLDVLTGLSSGLRSEQQSGYTTDQQTQSGSESNLTMTGTTVLSGKCTNDFFHKHKQYLPNVIVVKSYFPFIIQDFAVQWKRRANNIHKIHCSAGRALVQFPYDIIVCDVDGTLVRDYSLGLDPRLFDQIRAFRERGVRFCVASGRQYPNLSRVFEPVLEDVHFIAENGGCVFYRSQLEELSEMPYERVMELAQVMLEHPLCEPLISRPEVGYYIHPTDSYRQALHRINDFVMEEIEDPREIAAPIIKISAYVPHSIEEIGRELEHPWGEHFNMAVAGPVWIDFTCATKGTALKKLCDKWDIPRERALVFGDNFNDLSMINFTPNAYAMPESALAIQQAAGLGVCHNISDLFDELLQKY